MQSEKIDRRVVWILRWAVLIQVLFLAISSFSPRLTFRSERPETQSDFWSIAAILLMVLLLFGLSIKKIEGSITKRSFLLILYALALITIISRYSFSYAFVRRFTPMPNFTLFRWDAIFFLIIPLVFIAWQYSMREVVIYSIVIMVMEAVPIFLDRNNTAFFFAVANMLASFARSGIFFIVGWIENQLVQVQRAQHEQLAQANKKLRKFALTSEKLAQTQERNRIARELHDTLAHTLSGASVQLEAIKALFDRDPQKAKKMLTQTLENTKSGLAETRRALVDLRTSELEAYGLTKAMRNITTAAAERGGFEVEYNLDPELDMLPEDLAHCLFRTAQEAVENTLRHANPKKLTVSLQPDGENIHLVIEDDGAGFKADAVKKEHLGIRGIRERVEMLGGELTIDSKEGKGTKVMVNLMRTHD